MGILSEIGGEIASNPFYILTRFSNRLKTGKNSHEGVLGTGFHAPSLDTRRDDRESGYSSKMQENGAKEG